MIPETNPAPTPSKRLDSFITQVQGMATRAYGTALVAAVVALGLDWLIRDRSLLGLALRAIAATLITAGVMLMRLRLLIRLLDRYQRLREFEASQLQLIAKIAPSIAETI